MHTLGLLSFVGDDVSDCRRGRGYCANDRPELEQDDGDFLESLIRRQAGSRAVCPHYFSLFFSRHVACCPVSSGDDGSFITRVLFSTPQNCVYAGLGEREKAVYFYRYIVDTCTSTEEGRGL